MWSKKALCEILKVVHSNVTVTDNLSGEGMLVNGSKSLHPLTRAGKNLGFLGKKIRFFKVLM